MGAIGLAKSLRKEPAQAQDARQSHQFWFEITEAKVESLIEVDTESGMEAGAGFAVISFKAGGKVSQADAHRLRLKLRIKDAATGGRNLEVHRNDIRGWEQ